MSPTGKISEAMVEALKLVRGIISDGAATGFNWQDGDWAERLYASQQVTSRALTATLSVPTPGTGDAEGLKHRLWEALRFAASRSVITAAEEEAILDAFPSTPQVGDLGAVKVKPLTFEKQNVDGTLWCSNAAVAGMYRVKFVDEEWLTLRNDVIIGRSASSVAGMAIAQEHSTSRILSALSSTPVGEMVLVPREPTEAWVSTLANMRQGQSETPRCEPPTPYDEDIARRQIALVLRAASYIRERSAPQGGR